MIKITSTLLGLLSAILICIIFLIPLFLGAKVDGDVLISIITLIILGASWFFSAIVFMENADTVAKVFARAFLIWGAE